MATIFAGDESGNLGFDLARGGTSLFVLALVSFDDPDSARICVNEFKRANGMAGVDLSFHKTTSESLRERFFDFLNELSLTVWVLVVRKEQMEESLTKMPVPNLYALCLAEAIGQIPLLYRARAVLIVDEFDRSGRILLALGKQLKAKGFNRGFKKIATKRSSSEPLIQVADMVAGAAFWAFGKQQTNLLARLNHELVVNEYPKRKTT